MPKSRTIRQKKRKSNYNRNILMWFVCCGRNSAVEEVKYSEGELKMEEKLDESVMDDITDVVSDKGANGDITSVNKVLNRPPHPKGKSNKRRAPPPPNTFTDGGVADVNNNVDDQKSVDQSDDAQSKSEQDVGVNDYPEYLNPFAEEDDDTNKSANDGGETEKGAATNGITDYPDELNPFAGDEDDVDASVQGSENKMNEE